MSDTPLTDAAMCVLHPGVQPSTWYVQAEKCREIERALAAERAAHEATKAELAACRAERQNWMRALLESTLYPPPPYEVRLQADYFSGCTAYRAALLAAAKEPSDAG